MSYDDYELSAHNGAPIECYKFVGTFTTYRYTSAEVEVTVNGENYIPIPVKRNAVRAGTQEDDTLALEISLPFDVAVVRDYAYAESPPALALEVYRVHRGSNFATDFILMWKGAVTSFAVDGRWARIRVPSVFSRALQSNVPNVYYQAPCNHVLFDARCKVDRATYAHQTTVVDVTGRSILVDDMGAPQNALAAGELVNLRTGERRLILANALDVITVSYQFVDIQPGDQVELVYGCDHSFTTCKAKFNNGINFGGHPFIPSDNPFDGEIG